MTTSLVAIRCPVHDIGMEQRPQSRQTAEQKWCGAWWDCPKCRCSILFQSTALEAQLTAQRTSPN